MHVVSCLAYNVGARPSAPEHWMIQECSKPLYKLHVCAAVRYAILATLPWLTRKKNTERRNSTSCAALPPPSRHVEWQVVVFAAVFSASMVAYATN
jgi:hypothetical protein